MKQTFRLVLAFAFAATALAQKNIAYVANGTPDQVMDVYWPAAKASAAVLFIHGGSLLESGERRTSSAYAHVCEPFVAAGIACATMDYRLAPTNKWPAMPNDVAAAVVKMRQLIGEHGGDPHKLFLFGHSSGCLLASIVSTNATYLKSAGLKPSDLGGFIAMGCTLDRENVALLGLTLDTLRAPLSHDAEEMAVFGTPENWMSSNPASFISKDTPPALVVVADAERFMPPVLEEGSRFVRRLLEEGAVADLVVVPGKHMTSIANVPVPHDPTFAAIQKFIANPQPAAH